MTENKLKVVVRDSVKILNSEGELINPTSEEKLELVRQLLVSLDSKDFSTSALQMQIRDAINNIETQTNALTDEELRFSPVDVDTGLDLSNLATDEKLETLRLLLVSLDGKDFSTATLQAEIKDLIESGTKIHDSSGTVVDPSESKFQRVKRQKVFFDGEMPADFEFVTNWQDTEEQGEVDWNAINVEIFTTHESAENGFRVEYSHDGETVINADDWYTIKPSATSIGKRKNFNIGARYYRIIYNSAEAANRVIIAVTELRTNVKWSSHKVNEQIDHETDAEMVKSVITGEMKNGVLTGKYRNLSVDTTGRMLVNISPHTDVFSNIVTGQRDNQIQANFFESPFSDFVNITTSNGATVEQGTGQARFESGTNVNGSVTVETINKTKYRSAHEMYVFFTSAFTSPTHENTQQRIGIFNATDGFFIGYNGNSFGVTKRRSSQDSFIPFSSFNGDPLDGSSGSLFTRDGVPEAIDFENINVFAIRFGWLGSAHIIFEVLSPDGEFVIFHTIRQPNSDNLASVSTPVLPVRAEIVKNNADATNLIIRSGCWAAGSTSSLEPLSEEIKKDSLMNRSKVILHGEISSGQNAGKIVSVKLNPQGRFEAAVVGNPIGQLLPSTAVTQGMEDPQGNLSVPKLNADGHQLIHNPVGNEIIMNLFTGEQDIHLLNLDADEVFVTPWYDVKDFSSVTGIITASAFSAQGGLTAEWSDIGTEGPLDNPQYPVNPGAGQTVFPGVTLNFGFAPAARYFRVRYTNGENPASVVGSLTIRRVAVQSPESPLASTQTDLSLATITKAILAGRKDIGGFDFVRVTNNRNIGFSFEEQSVDMMFGASSSLSAPQSATITDTVTQFASSPPSGRKTIAIKANPSNNDTIYVGTTEQGTLIGTSWPLGAGDSIELVVDEGAAQSFWAIADSEQPQLLHFWQVSD